ncbi:MAG TPA: tyrosine-type recombinase/integrase [Solirubrobacteraceae bacterium]|nr:tyrosine-type recombinase/integrase [Solirubrobacteraceae bacterium]
MDKSIKQMCQDLAFGSYVKSTQGQYIRSVEELAAHFGRPVAELGRDDLRAYIERLRARGLSASWLKMRLGGIVFLYAKTLGRPQDVSFVVWPKQHSPLPLVLSQWEVAAVFDALHHPVYQAIAMVLYGTGLRIDEALSLEVGDIDGQRGVLRVRHGKGDRARDVRLSPGLLQYLRDYWSRERPPRPYLFASRRTGRPPTPDAVRHAFALAQEQAGITKRVRPHVLRHSYATHLLEAGTDIRVIQALLGHRSLQTTMRYTRVSTALMQKVPSPVDLLPSRGLVRR